MPKPTESSSIINISHAYQSRQTATDAPIVPVVTPLGNIKWLKIRPDVDVSDWLVVEWVTKSNRKTGVKSARLTSQRLREGAVLLEDAYKAEGWPEGWEAYKAFLRETFTRQGFDGEGNSVTYLLRRPKNMEFPADALPRVVADRLAVEAKKQASATMFDIGGIKRPEPRAKAK